MYKAALGTGVWGQNQKYRLQAGNGNYYCNAEVQLNHGNDWFWPTPAEQGERTRMFSYVREGLVFSRRVQSIGATQYPAV